MSKHLMLDDRIAIECALKERKSFKEISRSINKDCTTVSKEVRKQRIEIKTGAWGNSFNACKFRIECDKSRLCTKDNCRNKKCKNCTFCNNYCKEFVEEKCMLLDKPPYVCNGCDKRTKCTLVKKVYVASKAQKQYSNVLTESRTGINITEDDLLRIKGIIGSLVIQGQSFHHICINNADSIMLSEKTLYNYNDKGLFNVTNIDLPRKVRYRKRKQNKNVYKVDKKCRINRTFEDFLEHLRNAPNCPIVQMDTVIGVKGGKVLLTIHFTKAQFMLAFLRDANDSKSVICSFERLFECLGKELFMKLFPLIVTDNGSEFTNPSAIEFIDKNEQVTKIFYCDPQSPFQKPEIENNHEMIRGVLPKGTSFNNLEQCDIDLMMNHINSYGRENLNNRSPYEVFKFIYGEEILERLGAVCIPPNDIILTPNLLKR